MYLDNSHPLFKVGAYIQVISEIDSSSSIRIMKIIKHIDNNFIKCVQVKPDGKIGDISYIYSNMGVVPLGKLLFIK